MEALLTDEWVPEADALSILDEASLSLVRDRVRETGAAIGVDAEIVARAALVATELGRNQLRHAERGRIAVRPLVRVCPRDDGAGSGSHRGLEIVAADGGRGFTSIRRALEGVPRSYGSLGVGLAVVRENALEVDFDVRDREGTCIWARVFERGLPRRREIGVFGRALASERVSGDHAVFWRVGAHLTVAVSDGLGHGPPAREASSVAAAALRARPAGGTPEELLEACHRALGPTRGAVMAVARIDEDRAQVDVASTGNVAVQVTAPRSSHRFGGSSAVLGARNAAIRSRTETRSFPPAEVLVMTTDGIRTQLTLEAEPDLLREHPVVIAEAIVDRFGRTNDDALVLVAR